MDDAEYCRLQAHLTEDPGAGAVIRGSGGIRKLRWAGSGRGKRGGFRVVYYWWSADERISFLFIYAKNEQDDLSAEQIRMLRTALEL